jgi:hypothetical protein
MTGTKHLRNPGVILGVLAIVIALVGTSFAFGYAAKSKSTISACVSKSSGTFYKAKKCKGKDKKLTWSIQGPKGDPGANGTNGTNGTNGANGAVAGFSAVQSGSHNITADSSFVNIVTKALPAGHYMVNAKAQLNASFTSASQGASEECQLSDGTHTDGAQVGGALGPVFIVFVNSGMASMSLPISSATPVTVAVQCKNDLNSPPSGYSLSVSNTRITAVQTTANN